MSRSVGWMVFAGVGAVVLVGGIAVQARYDEWFTFPAYREKIASTLKDPESAQFRNERLSNGWLCGELNSKNSMGGYVGFKRFLTRLNGEAYIEDHGFVGPAGTTAVSTDRYIRDLEVKTAVLKRWNQLMADGVVAKSPSAAEIEEMSRKEIFDGIWKESCEA